MSADLLKNEDYRAFIRDIKQRVQAAQLKAAVAVSSELIRLYWYLGEQLAIREKQAVWGGGFIKQMSSDLQAEFPDMKGFSVSNLKYIRQWHGFWSNSGEATASIGQQAVGQIAQIPWGHNLVIISKCKKFDEVVFYVQSTQENNWSRAVLTHQIENGLFARKGKAINMRKFKRFDRQIGQFPALAMTTLQFQLEPPPFRLMLFVLRCVHLLPDLPIQPHHQQFLALLLQLLHLAARLVLRLRVLILPVLGFEPDNLAHPLRRVRVGLEAAENLFHRRVKAVSLAR